MHIFALRDGEPMVQAVAKAYFILVLLIVSIKMTIECTALYNLTYLAQATIRGERRIGSGEIEGHLYIKYCLFLKRNAFTYLISIPLEFGSS